MIIRIELWIVFKGYSKDFFNVIIFYDGIGYFRENSI